MKLCFLVHEYTPYRQHMLRRFRNELPIDQLHVFHTSATAGFNWTLTPPEGILWHDLAMGTVLQKQGQLLQIPRELCKGRRIMASLKNIVPDAVIVCGYGDAAHRYVIRHCRRNKISALLWADSNIRSEPSHGLRRLAKHLLLPRLLSNCSAVLPWGSYGKAYFIKYGASEDRIFIVPAEPDYAAIENVTPEAKEQLRRRLNLDPSRNRVLFVGRLAPEKRVDLLIDAFAQAADSVGSWDLVIVGDGPLRHSLQARVPEPLLPRVIFAGALGHQELPPVYHLAHLFVLPSDHEPWGIVVNEAAAAGLPLILSDAVGAGGDLLRGGQNGWAFSKGDGHSLGVCLQGAMGDGDLLTRGTQSRAIASHWRRIADPVKQLSEAIRTMRHRQESSDQRTEEMRAT